MFVFRSSYQAELPALPAGSALETALLQGHTDVNEAMSNLYKLHVQVEQDKLNAREISREQERRHLAEQQQQRQQLQERESKRLRSKDTSTKASKMPRITLTFGGVKLCRNITAAETADASAPTDNARLMSSERQQKLTRQGSRYG